MSKIFTTDRLMVRQLKLTDEVPFYQLMSSPAVMNPIPQSLFNKKESDKKLLELIENELVGDKVIWAITEIGNDELIGICGFLANSDHNKEIAYRFKELFWGKGYGSELAYSLIEYGFKYLRYDIIEADADADNLRSIKILSKYMTLINEFNEPESQLLTKRFQITAKNFFSS